MDTDRPGTGLPPCRWHKKGDGATLGGGDAGCRAAPTAASRKGDEVLNALPAATWIEAGGLAPVSDDSRFVWVPQLIRPPGECRPDRWWWVELGQRMGWAEVFTDDLKDPVKLQNLAGAAGGYTVERFTARPDHALRAPIRVDGNTVEERGTLFLDKRFPTKSGKIELWTEELEERFAAYGLSAVPHYYTDPDAAPVGEPTIAYERPALMPSPFQRGRTYTEGCGSPGNRRGRTAIPSTWQPAAPAGPSWATRRTGSDGSTTWPRTRCA